MKSSSSRGENRSRPQVRSAQPAPNGMTVRQPNSNAGNNGYNNSANNSSYTDYSSYNYKRTSAPQGFVEEPYSDMSDGQASRTGVVEEPFDYSLMGKPNSSAVVQKKKKSPSRAPSRTSSSSSNRSSSSSVKAAPAKKHKKKKKSSGNGVKVLAIAAGVLAICAGAFGIMYAAGVFKPRIEVTMADGTVTKIKAEDAFAEMTEGDLYYDGTIVNDINIGGMTRGDARNAISTALDAAPLNVDIDLKVNDNVYDLDLSSLTLTVNTDEILAQAYALNRPTDPEDLVKLTECYNAYQQMKNRPVSFQTAYTCSTEGLTELVHSVLDPLEVEQVDAVIVGFDNANNSFEIQPEVNGFSVDSEKAVRDVKALLDERTYEGLVDVDNEVIIPELTSEYIQNNFGRISSCTSSAGSNPPRNTNLSQACKYIDGTILNPGDEFSFNGVVGMRTAARGFVEATVIAGGQYEQGYGGGICQVSTMVYGAAVMADMEIVNRRAHAWPSSYVDPGLDATVDWGNIDFVFKNSSEHQIVLRAFFNNSDNTCTVQIYGHKLPDGQYIRFVSETISTTPHGDTEYVANPNLAVGERNTLRNAHDGMQVKSYKIWYDANNQEIRREDVATTNYRMYVKRVEVGTKLPDGGHAAFDASTGQVTTPSPTPTPVPTEAPATPTPTEAPAEDTPTPVPEDQGGGD